MLPPMVAVLTANITQFESAMHRAEAQMSSGGRLAGAMRGMGVLGAVAAGGILEIGAHSVKAAADFNASMERIHTQAHVPQGEIKTLSDGVLKLARSVGQSPESLAESLYHVESNFASLGIKGPQALHLVETAAKGAKIGNANVVDVTNALTAAVASGIPGVKNFDQAMGALNATVGSGDMSMQDLSSAFGTGMVAAVKLYGLSLDDVGAALATFGDNNIRGAKAGTQLRMTVQSLAVPAKAGKAILESWGMSSKQLSKDMQQGGLLKALEDLKDHMNKAGVSSKEAGDYITTIFGKKAGVGVNILYDQLDRLKSKYPELKKGAGDFGDAWSKTADQFKTKMDKAKEALETLGIKFGNFLIPWVEKAANAISKLVDWFDKHKEAAKLLAVAIGTVLVAAIASFVGEMLIAAAPVIAVIAFIGLLAAGVKYAYDHFKPFHDVVNKVVDVFKTKLVPAFKEGWDMIKAKVTPAVADLNKQWEKNQYWIKPLIDFVGQLMTKYVDLYGKGLVITIKSLMWFIGSQAKGVINFVSDLIHFIGDLIRAFQQVQRWADTAAGAISNVIGKISSIPGGSAAAKLLGFEQGGWVPGAAGEAKLAVVHGGEFVVSRAMMSSGSTGGAGPKVSGGGSSHPAGGGGGHVEAHIYIDGEEVRARTQTRTLRYNQRNSSNGLALATGR